MNSDKKIHLIRYLPWMICVLLIAAVPVSSMADYVRIKGTVVNVRQGPGTSHPVLFQAEQGEEFDLVSTEGLWCLVKLREGQEAWVFRKLVDIIEGTRPGQTATEEKPEESGEASSSWSWITKTVFIVSAFLLAVGLFMKRREIFRFTGVRLKEISGYKREQAFRYDNRKPSDDSWEL
jgi:hypothetical protein